MRRGATGPARAVLAAAAVAAATAGWAPSAELVAQQPSDTAGAGEAAPGDSAMQAALDSVRRVERGRRDAVVRSLRPGDRIRVRAGGRVVEGEFLRLARAHLFLRRGGEAGAGGRGANAADGEGDAGDRPPPVRPEPPLRDAPDGDPAIRRIPIDAMETLWIRLGHTGEGALWGGILGTVAGAVGGYFINEALCDGAEDCIFDGADAAVVFGIGGGLAGTGLGALVGRSVKGWRQWFPEEGEDAGGP